MNDFISHKVFFKSFCKTQFPHKSVNFFFILVIVKDTLSDFGGIRLLQNDFENSLWEIRFATVAPANQYATSISGIVVPLEYFWDCRTT